MLTQTIKTPPSSMVNVLNPACAPGPNPNRFGGPGPGACVRLGGWSLPSEMVEAQTGMPSSLWLHDHVQTPCPTVTTNDCGSSFPLANGPFSRRQIQKNGCRTVFPNQKGAPTVLLKRSDPRRTRAKDRGQL